MEQELRESERRLSSILQGSPIPTFVLGRDHRVLYWNRAVEVTGISERAALVRKAFETLVTVEVARRLSRLGGSDPTAWAPGRSRPLP